MQCYQHASKSQVSTSGDLIVCPFYVSSSVLAGSFCCNTPPESESNMNRLRGIKWCRWTHLNNLLWVMRSMQNLWNHNHQYRHYHWSGFAGSCTGHHWCCERNLVCDRPVEGWIPTINIHNHNIDGTCSCIVFKMNKMVFIADMLISKPDLTHP